MNALHLTSYPQCDSADLAVPASRHLIHTDGCPLYIWWALGKRRNLEGLRWRCWFVYLEYRQADGRSAYRQLELPLEAASDPQIWQQLARVELIDACADASRRRLICE